jgi:hypothetical protein
MKALRWIVVLLLILAVVIGGIYLYRKYRPFTKRSALINPSGQTLQTRIKTPDGYYRDSTATGFTAYTRKLKVLRDKSALKRYDGANWGRQNWHAAILDFDTGSKNLQQCADACLRLHAEYLWTTNKKEKLVYEFTSGDKLSWSDYAKGKRAKVNGNNVSFSNSGNVDDSRKAFRSYLDCIFTYAGTISVNHQFKKLRAGEAIQPGDVIVKPGSPGHAIMVVDVCQNNNGKKLYLISQGYTPAVQIHIVNNTSDRSISPWFELEGVPISVSGAGFSFTNANVVRLAE